MSNTTVVPHLSGILRSSPFQQGAARYSPTKIAREEVCQFQKYSTVVLSCNTRCSGVVAIRAIDGRIALDPCQWQWCEKTSGFGPNPILASSLDWCPSPP